MTIPAFQGREFTREDARRSILRTAAVLHRSGELIARCKTSAESLPEIVGDNFPKKEALTCVSKVTERLNLRLRNLQSLMEISTYLPNWIVLKAYAPKPLAIASFSTTVSLATAIITSRLLHLDVADTALLCGVPSGLFGSFASSVIFPKAPNSIIRSAVRVGLTAIAGALTGLTAFGATLSPFPIVGTTIYTTLAGATMFFGVYLAERAAYMKHDISAIIQGNGSLSLWREVHLKMNKWAADNGRDTRQLSHDLHHAILRYSGRTTLIGAECARVGYVPHIDSQV